MIRFMCIYCGQRILARDGTSGKQGKCPKCSHTLKIPWTLKGRPGIGGYKLDSLQDKISLDPDRSTDTLSGEAAAYLPGYQDDKPPAFDVVTLYGEKTGWLIPHYDELSLFLTAFILLLLAVSGIRTKHDVVTLTYIRTIILAVSRFAGLFSLFFILGFILSLFYIFIKKKKTRIEKYLMLFFAVTANAVIGIIAGIHVIRQCPTWQLIFPIWNILNGFLLLLMFKVRIINESCISDRKATLGRVVISLMLTIVIFILCNYVFKLYWAITFSVCTIYATNFERAMQNVLINRANLPSAEPV